MEIEQKITNKRHYEFFFTHFTSIGKYNVSSSRVVMKCANCSHIMALESLDNSFKPMMDVVTDMMPIANRQCPVCCNGKKYERWASCTCSRCEAEN